MYCRMSMSWHRVTSLNSQYRFLSTGQSSRSGKTAGLMSSTTRRATTMTSSKTVEVGASPKLLATQR
ncbi:hypothetical protein PFISCL1PPCAC_25951 [Pristionchus fissidentatus]|uniref:Uncharacterized protein n=1 Tax=Pristionchus fissidentatus TaxID=1538716 RepID=A0AAV5VBP2_9BILA|nr:hypothetical protein PFISCL1PPCAC_8402 [Pristionchus fissidentatus]GMT34654.1 hypothetical protein PFISCL1PPCAC_25951 [Pristionchus fissidentatus]